MLGLEDRGGGVESLGLIRFGVAVRVIVVFGRDMVICFLKFCYAKESFYCVDISVRRVSDNSSYRDGGEEKGREVGLVFEYRKL